MAYPATGIDKATDFFNPYSYEGTASGSKVVTDLGFQPDMLWFKQYDATRSWVNMTSPQGVTKALATDSDAVEQTNSNYLASFDAGGFTTGATQDNGTNTSGGDYMAYSWKAGTTSGLTGGTITPSAYSINTTSGFGIYKYTGNGTAGATIAHGLGAAPKFMIIKCLDAAGTDWVTWGGDMAVNEYMYLNSQAAVATDTAFMNSVLPSSTLITLGDKGNVNANAQTFIAYVWVQKKGYSRFGSYLGNGETVGTFFYTGFKPSFIMVKRTNFGENWAIQDNKRTGFNQLNYQLYPNDTNASVENERANVLSNGFKCCTTNNEWNGNGDTYTVAAFGQPFIGSNGVCVTGY
jgi:hypothetical protein